MTIPCPICAGETVRRYVPHLDRTCFVCWMTPGCEGLVEIPEAVLMRERGEKPFPVEGMQ